MDNDKPVKLQPLKYLDGFGMNPTSNSRQDFYGFGLQQKLLGVIKLQKYQTKDLTNRTKLFSLPQPKISTTQKLILGIKGQYI